VALKIVGAIATALGIKKEDPVQAAVAKAEATGQDPYLAGITAKGEQTPPWEGEAQDMKPLPQAGDVQVAPTVCAMHLWSSGVCVRCGTPKAGNLPKTAITLPKKALPKAPVVVQAPPPPPPALKPKSKGKPQKAPWVERKYPEGHVYTILDAFQEMWDDRPGTLMIIKTATGESFRVEMVKEVTPTTAHVVLVGSNGMQFSPRVAAREVAQYTPMWR
jgi:hypothetical protein